MNAACIIGATTITKVWLDLGGDPPRRGRARAFYRNGDNQQSVSLNDAKQCWYDHRDAVGGGVLDLIQRVLGCDRGAALRWLSDFTGIPLDDRRMTPAERGNYARAARNADALALRLADFAWGLELVSERRLTAADALGIDSEAIALWHRQAHVLKQATPKDIAETWRAMPEARGAVEQIGRRDREHAENITRAIVNVLAVSQEQDRAA